jgi:hypothetical protein
MAIPIGTTSRQVQWLARWVLAGMMILGMIAWWWPGYRSWGSAVAALLLVLGLWLVSRILDSDRSVPGHPFHLVVLVPAGVLAVHFVRHGLLSGPPLAGEIKGALDISLIYWLCLLSLGVLLTQSLLPLAARHTAVLGAAGAAMMLGPAAAILAGDTAPVRTALALLGFAGIGVWLTMLWGLDDPAGPDSAPDLPPAPRKKMPAALCVLVAAVAAGALSLAVPLQALLVAGVVAVALLAAGLVFPARRALVLLAGGALAIAVTAVLTLVHWVRAAMVELIGQGSRASVFGVGERAFDYLTPADSGLAILLGMVGWAGTLWLIGGTGVCVVWMLLHARGENGSPSPRGAQGRAVVWSSAAGCCVAALIAPGGLFIPATALAASFVLGLLPVMLGKPRRGRSGLLLLVGVGTMLALLGVAPGPGLFDWSLGHFSKNDTVLHFAIGLLAAMLLAWQLGARRIWLGLVGIVLAASVGGVGEAVQMLASERSADLRDWLCHAAGSACAVGPYVLCMMARWCESPDARTDRPS